MPKYHILNRPRLNLQKHATSSQTVVLFKALYMISSGSGGMKSSLPSFAADHFDYQHPIERDHKISLFNWYYFFISLAILMSNTMIVYVQGNVSWGAGFGIMASISFISIFIFLCGTPRYRHIQSISIIDLVRMDCSDWLKIDQHNSKLSITTNLRY